MKRKISLLILSLVLVFGLGLTACSETKKEVSIKNAGDLEGLNLAVQAGTIGEEIAEEIKEKDASTKISAFAKYIDAITALKQAKADAVIMDNAPAEFFVAQEENSDLMILAEELSTEEYAVAIKKGNSELLDAVNAVLADMKESGELEAIIMKYQKDADQVKSVDLNEGAAGGKLVMGTESGFAPYEYKEGDLILGIDVEIAAAVAKHLDKELVIDDMDFDALIPALNSGKIDLIAAGMTVNEERKENVDFSTPYIDAKQVVVIRKASFK